MNESKFQGSSWNKVNKGMKDHYARGFIKVLIGFTRIQVEGTFFPLILAHGGTTQTVKTATIVLQSLTPNAQSVFKVLAEHQLAHPDEEGFPVNNLYSTCREPFLVSSQVTLNSHLTEFKDHVLVKFRKNSDGQDCLYIPLTKEALEKVIEWKEIKVEAVESTSKVCESKGKGLVAQNEDQLSQDDMDDMDEHLTFLSRRFSKLKFQKNFGAAKPNRNMIDKSKFKCFKCGLAGHFASECRKSDSIKKKFEPVDYKQKYFELLKQKERAFIT
ncbi:hypothetical protein AgCh_003611 [Apium graveolens]